MQDLVCALDESDLRINLSESSANSQICDRERKRKTRKRRTTSACINNHCGNIASAKQTHYLSDCSSSSLEVNSKECIENTNGYNYSGESEDIPLSLYLQKKQSFLPNHKEHHHKKKQPICVESDSVTENGIVPLNLSRKYRKKRIKKMAVEFNNDHDIEQQLHHRHHRLDKLNSRYRLKSVDHLKPQDNDCNMQDTKSQPDNDCIMSCTIKHSQCDDDSFSGSSLSDNDSTNEGQLGDDEMTDFYNEPDNDNAVYGIPGHHQRFLTCKKDLYMISNCNSQVNILCQSITVKPRLQGSNSNTEITTLSIFVCFYAILLAF